MYIHGIAMTAVTASHYKLALLGDNIRNNNAVISEVCFLSAVYAGSHPGIIFHITSKSTAISGICLEISVG